MLKSFWKAMIFLGFVSSVLLFAQESYAQKIESMSAKDFANKKLSGAVLNVFNEEAPKIACGSTDNMCDVKTQVCLRCRRDTKVRKLGVKLGEGTKDEGKCVSISSFNPDNIRASWPDCKVKDAKLFGSGVTVKLTLEESGFISEAKKKVLGITFGEHSEEFVGNDDKKYALFVDKGKPTINYGSEDFGGCEVLPVKVYNMQSCFFCPMARLIFKAVNEVTEQSFENFASSFMILIVVVYAIWLALATLQQVFPLTKKDVTDYFELIIKQTFKFMIAYYLLTNSSFLFESFISPVLEGGLKMGEMIQDGNLLQPSKKINTPETRIGGGYFNVKYSNGKTLYAQVENYLSSLQSQMAYMQAIGTSLFCVGSKQLDFNIKLKEWAENIAMGMRMMTLGGVLSFFGFLISIIFAFYFLDAILQLGLLGMMMPLMIAGWPFKITAHFAKKGLSFLLNTFFVFFFTGFVISVNVVLIDQTLSLSNQIESYSVDASGKVEENSDGLGAIAKAMNEQNISELNRATNIGGVGFLLLSFASLFGFQFMKQVSPLASELSGGGLVSNMSGSIATMAASSLKGVASKAAAPATKAIGAKFNAAGGAVGIAAGAVGKAAGVVSNVARATGHNKFANAAQKVSQAGKGFQGTMSQLRKPSGNQNQSSQQEEPQQEDGSQSEG